MRPPPNVVMRPVASQPSMGGNAVMRPVASQPTLRVNEDEVVQPPPNVEANEVVHIHSYTCGHI